MSPQETAEQISGLQPVAFVLLLARISPLFVIAPLFSSSTIPPRVKGLIAVALAVGMCPVATAGQTLPTDPVLVVELLVKELLVGLAFAFALSCLLAGFQAVGALLDIQIGFAFGATVDPMTGGQGAVLGKLYAMVGVAILVAIGGDQLIIAGLARTYDLVPLTAFPELRSMVSGTFSAFSGIFVAALQVGAPVLMTLLLTDAAFAMVSRVVPQMNVFAVGFPAKVIVGMLMIVVTLPFAAGWFGDRLTGSVASALSTLKVAG
ncbi:flagellar biosynthetic protein FliR [Patulibacter minatonensis]|uniref:flagellar biosynthetic protein FliR n=1 Tax=Patulibacter minatonensis TaxID=298163 RepID=UPI00047C2AD4|nr:flagellar biosynthetic protein FliR [Patulibacter minatonensis]